MAINKRLINTGGEAVIPTSFNTIIWTGNGTSSRSFTGVGFKPDLVWAKSRTNSFHNTLFDSVRGAERFISSDSTASEKYQDASGYLTSFNSDGFSTTGGSPYGNEFFNYNGSNFVAWCWKAGGAAVTNTDGSITSEVSANVDAGFSVVKWTGSFNTGQTIGHGLSQTPSVIMVRTLERTSNLWYVHHQSLGNTKSLILQETSAENSDLTWTNTSTTFGANYTGTSFNWLAYCFAEKAGFSKFGSYTGVVNSSNPIDVGFEPAFILVKRYSSAENWVIFDNKRSNNFLMPDTDNAEITASSNSPVFTSTGFYFNGISSGWNISGSSYIYMAFANQF